MMGQPSDIQLEATAPAATHTVGTSPGVIELDSASIIVGTSIPIRVPAGTSATTIGHIHGPDCGHDHGAEKAAEPKYPDINKLPRFDPLKTFFTSSGAVWAKSAPRMMTTISAFVEGNVPQGQCKVLFLNAFAYQWLLTARAFTSRFKPARAAKTALDGVLGIYADRLVVMTDAQFPPNQQLTDHMAFYFCDEILYEEPEQLLTEDMVTHHVDGCDCPLHVTEVDHTELSVASDTTQAGVVVASDKEASSDGNPV